MFYLTFFPFVFYVCCDVLLPSLFFSSGVIIKLDRESGLKMTLLLTVCPHFYHFAIVFTFILLSSTFYNMTAGLLFSFRVRVWRDSNGRE